MKGYSFFYIGLFCLFFVFLADVNAVTITRSGIGWTTDYNQALKESKERSTPIVLFFTGSDWCGWCTKLEREVLDTPEFANTAADKLIFVKLDFPMNRSLNSTIAERNERLKKKFSIRSFPTILIIDSNQQPIGMTGYRSGGGQKYAQHLIKMVKEFATYKKQIKRLNSHTFTGKELKRLYQKAQELGLENDANLLMRIGIQSDLTHFFLAERYRFLVKSGQTNSSEALKVKNQLLSSDPDNAHLTHYQVAVVEFEALSEELEQGKISPEEAVTPLEAYINNYGSEDRENLWRLNMVISQVFLEKNQLEDALKFAEHSHAAAPSSIQPEIALAIESIQHQISKEN